MISIDIMRKNSSLWQSACLTLAFIIASVQYARSQDAREKPIKANLADKQESKTEQTYILSNPNGVISIPDYKSAFFAQEVTKVSSTKLQVTIRLFEPEPLIQPYPVQSIPRDFQKYLEPTPHIQSDDANIASTAAKIKSEANATTQQDLVDAVLQWNKRHLHWSRPSEIPDAVTALNRRSGNCIAFTHLPVAILRNLSIPTRTSRVFIAHPEANILVRHYVLEVYYAADKKWVTYEPQLGAYGGKLGTNYLYMYNDPDWDAKEHRRTRPFSEDPQTQVRYGRQETSTPVLANGTQLPVPKSQPDLYFGGSLASNGHTIAVGAYRSREPWHASLNGETYLYHQDSTGHWKEQQVIQNEAMEKLFHAQVIDYNGVPLANSSGPSDFVTRGNYALASSGFLKSKNPTIFKYEDDQWIEHQELNPPTGVAFDEVQQTLALSHNLAVVGVRRNLDQQRGYETCEAYIYEKDNNGSWKLDTKLTSLGDPQQYKFKEFPSSRYELSLNCQEHVAVSGHDIAIGTYYQAEWGIPGRRGFMDIQPASLKNKEPLGKVFIFNKKADGRWTKVDLLSSSGAESRECIYPTSLTLDQNRLGVGANSCSYKSRDFVAVYSKSGRSWDQITQIEAPETIKKYRLNFATDLSLRDDRMGIMSDLSTSAFSSAKPIAFIFKEQETGTWKPVKQFKGLGKSVDFRKGAFVVESPDHSTLLGNHSNRWQTEAIFKQYRKLEKEYWMQPPAVSMNGNRMLLESRGVGVHKQPHFKNNDIIAHKTYPVPVATLYDQDNSGKWNPKTTFRIPSTEMFHRQGSAVALQGSYAAVGVYGSVYLFVRQKEGWSQGIRIQPEGSHRYSNFGHSVAISGNTMVVGASNISMKSAQGKQISSAGGVFVFEGQGTCWEQVAMLRAPVLQGYSSFGSSVAIDHNNIIVGAPNFDGSRKNSGAAYVFEKENNGNWKFTYTLTPDRINNEDYLGSSIALQHGVAIVGAYGSTIGTGMQHRGSAYAFRRNPAGDWAEIAIIGSRQAKTTEYLGHPVAFNKGQVILGSISGDTKSDILKGSAYVEPFAERGAAAEINTHPAPRCAE